MVKVSFADIVIPYAVSSMNLHGILSEQVIQKESFVS